MEALGELLGHGRARRELGVADVAGEGEERGAGRRGVDAGHHHRVGAGAPVRSGPASLPTSSMFSRGLSIASATEVPPPRREQVVQQVALGVDQFGGEPERGGDEQAQHGQAGDQRRCPSEARGRASAYVRTIRAIHASAAHEQAQGATHQGAGREQGADEVGAVCAQRQHQQREKAEHQGGHDRRAGPVPPKGEVAGTGDERRQQRREQRGAEGGEAAGVGPTGRVGSAFRPVVADGWVPRAAAAPPRGCARRRLGRASCGERRSVGLGDGCRGPVVEHRGGCGAAGRGWPASRVGGSWVEPTGAGGRSRAARRVSAGFRRSAGGRRAGAGERRAPTRAERCGARTVGGGPSGPAVAPAFKGSACAWFPAGRVRGARRPAGRWVSMRRIGGTGINEPTALPVSGGRARPRWSPPGPPRDDTYGFDGAERPRKAGTLRRSGCRVRAAAALHDEAGSSVLRVTAGPEAPARSAHLMSRPPPPGASLL